MHKPSKSKAEMGAGDAPRIISDTEVLQKAVFVAGPRIGRTQQIEFQGKISTVKFPSLLQSAEDARSDAETLSALQFALAETESEQEYSHRMNEREQDRYDMQEAE